MTETIFTKSSRDGRTIEVKAHEYTAGEFIAQVFVAGKFLAGPAKPQALKTPKGEVTYFLGGGIQGDKPAVGLTTAEAAQIEEALIQRRNAWRQTAAGQALTLRNERERLLAEYLGARDEQSAAFDRLHDQQETDLAWRARREAEPKVQAAWQALRAFDQAHPQIALAWERDLELPAEEA